MGVGVAATKLPIGAEQRVSKASVPGGGTAGWRSRGVTRERVPAGIVDALKGAINAVPVGPNYLTRDRPRPAVNGARGSAGGAPRCPLRGCRGGLRRGWWEHRPAARSLPEIRDGKLGVCARRLSPRGAQREQHVTYGCP